MVDLIYSIASADNNILSDYSDALFENIFSILKNSNVDIVGCDTVELSPDYDNTKVSTVLACKVLRELALVLGYNNEKNKNK